MVCVQVKAQKRPEKTIEFTPQADLGTETAYNNKKQNDANKIHQTLVRGKISRAITLLDSNVQCSRAKKEQNQEAYKEIGKYSPFKGKEEPNRICP